MFNILIKAMKLSVKYLFACFLICFGMSHSIAQSSCEQNLKQAEEWYMGGDYDNCIQLLEKTIKECNLSYSRKEIAMELLAKTYIQQDNLTSAEKYIKLILKNNPYYELKENSEEEDFEILVKKFAAHPLFSIGARNTALSPFLSTIKTYSVSDHFNYSSNYIAKHTELRYYFISEFEFKETFSINADLLWFDVSYSRNLNKVPNYELYFNENLSFFEIPVYLKKYFALGKNFLAYSSAGIGYLHMTNASATASILYNVEDKYTESKTTFTSTDAIDMLSQRNKNTFEWLIGGGIGYRFKNLGIFIDARYSRTFNTITNSAQRYNNTLLVNNYYYVDNGIKLNKYEIGLSLSYTLINSIKKVK